LWAQLDLTGEIISVPSTLNVTIVKRNLFDIVATYFLTNVWVPEYRVMLLVV